MMSLVLAIDLLYACVSNAPAIGAPRTLITHASEHSILDGLVGHSDAGPHLIDCPEDPLIDGAWRQSKTT